MKYFDLIIKYLSGDFTGKEAEIFEKDLSQNEDLRSEFNQVKLISDKLEEELKIEHADSVKRENIFREITVEHDLKLYNGPPEGDDEVEFISKLRESAKRVKDEPVQRRVPIYKKPLFYLAIAASVAVLIILTLPKATPEQLFAQYYKPTSDEILIHLSESSRGEAQYGISLYRRGLYKQSMAYFKPYIREDNCDPYIRLFYAISSIEENNADELTSILKPEIMGIDDEIDLAIKWYYSLYLIRKKETGQAKEYLRILSKEKNPYFRQAKRLLRKID